MTEVQLDRRRVTDEELAEALRASGGIQLAAVAWLEKNRGLQISRSAVSMRLKDSPELRKAAGEGREKMLDVCENKLFTKINEGNMTAIIFFLKCHGKNRGYIEKIQSEISAAGPGKVEFTWMKAGQGVEVEVKPEEPKDADVIEVTADAGDDPV